MKKMPYLVAIVTFLSLCVFGTVLSYSLWYDPQSEEGYFLDSMPFGEDKKENIVAVKKIEAGIEKPVYLGHPVRLIIPSLSINTKVQEVGINKKGNMATPSNFKDVGWYKYGTVPGELGSAVIAGHVDNGLSFAGVFKHLVDLKEGADIFLEADDGRKLHFVVSGREVYDYDAIVQEVFAQNDASYIKLITCTGNWVADKRTHDKRLVITAVRVVD